MIVRSQGGFCLAQGGLHSALCVSFYFNHILPSGASCDENNSVFRTSSQAAMGCVER
jgi:hypothetical protein